MTPTFLLQLFKQAKRQEIWLKQLILLRFLGFLFKMLLRLTQTGLVQILTGVDLSIRLLDPLDNPSTTLSVTEATAVNNASVINPLASYDIRDDFDNIDTTAAIMGNATQVVATNIDSLDDMRAAFNDTGISSFEFSQSFVDGGGLNNISVADYGMLGKAVPATQLQMSRSNDSVDNIEAQVTTDSQYFINASGIHATGADVGDALNMQSNTPGTVGAVADTFDLARVETWDAGLRSAFFNNQSPKEGFPLQNRDYLVVPNDSPDGEATELTLVHLNGNTAQPESMSVSDSAATFTVSKEDHPALFDYAISNNNRNFWRSLIIILGQPPESINPIYMELSTRQEAQRFLEAENAPTTDNLTLNVTYSEFFGASVNDVVGAFDLFDDVERVFVRDVGTIEHAMYVGNFSVVDKYSLSGDVATRALSVEEAKAVLNADNADAVISSYSIDDSVSAIRDALNSSDFSGLISNADSVNASIASIDDAVELRFGTSDFSVHVDTLDLTATC